jgi:hypothetical protein
MCTEFHGKLGLKPVRRKEFFILISVLPRALKLDEIL